MDIKNLDVFAAATKNMRYLSARQEVLAENIANANTPDYLAKDIQKPSFDDELKSQMALRTTNNKHFAMPQVGASSGFKVYTPQPVSGLTIDGNGVDIESQINQVSSTKGEYNEMLKLINKHKSMIEVASKVTGS
ncbi:MAG: flagellar basal body rod protein FlgB [Alphaproteobacteria bacterium]